MRDLLVTILVFASLPFILRKPFVGVLAWTWLGLMNPHRLCWGFATTFPFAEIVALTLLASLLISQTEVRRIPWVPISRVLVIFFAWMVVTTVFAFQREDALLQLEKVAKIQLISFLTMMLLTTKERVIALVWVMVISLGFYGLKGGIFTIATGGNYHVWGPAGTFIGGNNELGLALIMTVPLMRFLQLMHQQRWVKIAMSIAMGLSLFAILGTQSRGALLGLVAMAFYLIMKSRRRFAVLVLVGALLPVGITFMPESWHDRMDTIAHYKQDGSAMGRINAWWTAWNVALHRPLVGGGFNMWTESLSLAYSPDPSIGVHVAHSIYFQVLGEQGFVGLFLFLILCTLALHGTRQIVTRTRGSPDFYWLADLGLMVRVSLIGYAVSGAFLSLAYFDFFYTLLALIVGAERLVNEKVLEEGRVPAHRKNALASPKVVPAHGALGGGGRPTAKGRESFGSVWRRWIHSL